MWVSIYPQPIHRKSSGSMGRNDNKTLNNSVSTNQNNRGTWIRAFRIKRYEHKIRINLRYTKEKKITLRESGIEWISVFNKLLISHAFLLIHAFHGLSLLFFLLIYINIKQGHLQVTLKNNT